MKLHRIILVVTTLSALILTGCNKQPLSEDKFIKVYADLVIAQDTTKRPSTLIEIKKKVFAKNRISEKDYDATFKYYNENPERWEAFFDSAISYLEHQRKKLH